KLANHVQQYNGFWENPENARIFGEQWRGSDTSFEEFRFGTQYRAFLKQHLSQLPQGNTVLEHLVSIDTANLLSLGRYSKAGHLFRGLSVAVRSVFGGVAHTEFESDANRRLTVAKAVTGIDPTN